MTSAFPILLTVAGAAVLFSLRFSSRRIRLALDICVVGLCTLGFLALGGSPLRPLTAAQVSGSWPEALAVAWWISAVRLAATLARFQFGRAQRSRQTRLVSDLVAAGIYVCGGLVILNDVLRLPIGGVVATSGVIAIVLGLALQNTLGDVFAGVAVGVEQPFHAGDRIRLGEDLEGRVVQINWRSIRIQTDENDLAIIPNSAVAKAQIVNRSVPSERSTHLDVPADAAADPRLVQTLLGHAVMLCRDVLAEPKPTVFLQRLGIRTCTYRLVFDVADTRLLGQVKSDLSIQARRQLRHAALLPKPPNAQAAAPEPEARGLTVLRGTRVFEGLASEQLEALASRLQVKELTPGERLFAQGDVEAKLYMVERGVLEISRREGAGAALGRIGVGEYIGEIGLLTGAPRAVTATALTDCVLRSLDKEALQPLLTSQPELSEAFEASVKRGVALLDRDEAARAVSATTDRSTLLERIRSFFKDPEA